MQYGDTCSNLKCVQTLLFSSLLFSSLPCGDAPIHRSARAYVVSARGAARLAKGAVPLEAPIDVYLRGKIASGDIDAFAATLSLAQVRATRVHSTLYT